MKLALITNLRVLNQHKQHKLWQQMASLRLESNQLEARIEQSLYSLEAIYTERGNYKRDMYQRTLRNALIGQLEVARLNFALGKFESRVKHNWQEREDLQQSLSTIQEQLQKLNQNLNFYLRKEEKYKTLFSHCQQESTLSPPRLF